MKKNVFYKNDERIEEFVYSKRHFPVVIVGSSLSGFFQNKSLFQGNYFDLYLPMTGSCSGIEVIRKSNKIPKRLFIEINKAYKGLDTSLMHNIFETPLYKIRQFCPVFQRKNQLLPNIIDRIKTPVVNDINNQKPPAILFSKLMDDVKKEWYSLPDTVMLKKQFTRLTQSIQEFSKKGCEIYFFELPMDSSLFNSVLLCYQRNYFTKVAKQNGFTYISADTSHTYNTGDGIHLLKEDVAMYLHYFKSYEQR